MPNLVGIGLSQVPTNGMLGGLAYQDPEHASIKNLDLKNLSQINSEIADTAVDVFVYDTSKDSDGGAWRKRTQNTSWYNETLNTSTRGSRKEFPAVAVIVATIDDVIIYDGDDPDLPMWMIFESGSSGNAWENYYLGRGTGISFNPDVTGVAMLNATLVVGKDGAGAGNFVESYTEIDFISDNALHRDAGSAQLMNNSIVSRNGSAGGYYNVTSTFGVIVHQDINDVAMTVLPNAPIDSATGLPIPTIAVATDGGISVLKDNGSIFDMYPNDAGERPALQIGFTESNKLVFRHNFNWVYYYEIPNSDLNAAYWNGLGGYIGRFTSIERDWDTNYKGIPVNAPSNTDITEFLEDRALGHTNGLDIIDINNGGLLGYGMHAGIATNFNTGYQHGDIKGAFLSDTTAESLSANTNLAPNAIAEGTNRLSSETYDSGDTSWSMVDASGTSNGYVNIGLKGLTIGQSYFISMTWDGNATLDAGYEHRIAHLNGTAGENPTNFTHWNKTNGSAETLTGVFIAQSVNDDDLIIYCNAITLNVSNFNVRAVDDEDRSIKNNGLAVYGTVTKTAVATGAELVGYSGFTASNYLRYNASDMAFGTGDFSVSLWCIPSTDTTNEFILELDDASQGSNRFYFLTTNTSTKRLYLPWDSDIAGSDLTPGQWNHVVVGRKSGYGFVYVNNRWIADGYKAWTTALNGNGFGTISNYSAGPSSVYAWSGSLALIRISGSAPSAEQVSKMYHDEKCLFHENSKATLYGSSDAVTALAFDDTTNLLHVGTSAGRSEFQGLRRINNTTDAVTTAISASNGLVAEQ